MKKYEFVLVVIGALVLFLVVVVQVRATSSASCRKEHAGSKHVHKQKQIVSGGDQRLWVCNEDSEGALICWEMEKCW